MSTSKPTYYGPFFWVAAVSFVVPLVVAAKAIHTVPLTTKPTSHPDVSGVDHGLWDYLLKTYVENGLVDYDGLSRDYLFRVYLRQLSAADPSKLTTSDEKLALLCNAYNAFVMNGVVTHDIRDSVMRFQHDGKAFFDVEEHLFCGRTMSLNFIEHQLIRQRFGDPRVHVALVCAARSCPAIRPEAFDGKRLEVQLDDQSVQFANNPHHVRFDAASKTLVLNPILNWYGSDWESLGGYLPWLAERVKDDALRDAILWAERDKVQVSFSAYDWSLNSQAPSRAAASASPKKHAEFGSGSVPNE